MEFALLLSLLDGEVEKILFLPSDIDKSLHSQYYREAGISYEVYLNNNTIKYNKIYSSTIVNKSTELKTQWIIPTSGTTNIPKLVTHTFESLTRTAKRNMNLGERYRWGLVFDIYRFSGIQVFLQSVLAGSRLIISESSQSMSEILGTLAHNKCNALSATPSFWRKVLMSKKANELKLERITLGGEIADENTLQALKKSIQQQKYHISMHLLKWVLDFLLPTVMKDFQNHF